jgi:MFS family permease
MKKKQSKGISRQVYALGIVSFFADVSSEMIFPILPLFLTTFLGAGKEAIGLIEGVADSSASLLEIFIGYWSDKAGSRKRFVLGGYGLSALLKVGIAAATSWPQVLVFRGLERVGKSIRTSPRDAIIAATTPKEARGKAFGLHRAMDTTGAIVGPLVAYAILAMLGSTEAAYRSVFYLALIPAAITVAIILLFVREPKQEEKPQAAKRKGFWESLKGLGRDYKRFVLVSCLFSLSYFSFALLIVRAAEIGIRAEDIILMYAFYNIVYALVSIPGGALSDLVGRKPVIAASFALYALVLAGFAFATSFWQLALLFAVYAVFVALDESVNKAYVADMVKDDQRAMALGAYNTAVGAAYLPASVAVGALWAVFGAPLAFGAAAVIAVVSAAALLLYCK